LEEEWNRRVATMITGEITYVEFHHAYEFPPKTRADVTAALRRINSDMPCESIREFACDLMNRIVPEDPPVWPRQRFLFKGDKTRDERTGGLEIFDGSDITVAAEHANFRQITIGARSGTVAPQLHGKHSFFWFPQALG